MLAVWEVCVCCCWGAFRAAECLLHAVSWLESTQADCEVLFWLRSPKNNPAVQVVKRDSDPKHLHVLARI